MEEGGVGDPSGEEEVRYHWDHCRLTVELGVRRPHGSGARRVVEMQCCPGFGSQEHGWY